VKIIRWPEAPLEPIYQARPIRSAIGTTNRPITSTITCDESMTYTIITFTLIRPDTALVDHTAQWATRRQPVVTGACRGLREAINHTSDLFASLRFDKATVDVGQCVLVVDSLLVIAQLFFNLYARMWKLANFYSRLAN